MQTIQILPDDVIDRIAAGEVVERPASVVKELVENALDAGATTITVDVEAGGRRLVRVVDDGSGMSAADARLALSRHATSKLRAVDDLWSLGTMGFRGEALPSIASVSRMTLVTRRREDLAATRLDLDGGRLVEAGEVGGPPGTCIEVRDLLHNVPARLKFLKGEATEASHVTDVVQRLALAHPRVHLRLRHLPLGGRLAHAGRPVVDCPPVTDGADRVRAVLGARVAERIHACDGEEGGVRVVAYLGAPDLAQTTARGVQLFVGRRFVRDRALLHAVTMGYGELVPRGRYPVAIVMIDVPGATVDVNVHPQKLEVRFSDASAVAAAVRHVVRRGVAAAPWLAEAAGAAPVQMRAVASYAPPTRTADLVERYAESTTRALFPMGGLARAAEQQSFARQYAESIRPGAGAGANAAAGAGAGAGAAAGAGANAGAGAGAGAATAAGFFASLRYLGQLDRTYLVCEAAGELVLIDQHAAHERVELQRLRERRQDVPVQRLLFPQTLEVTPELVAVVEEHAAVLAGVGFELEPFGGATVAVKTTPAALRGDPSEVLRELLGDLAEPTGGRALDERVDRVIATIACHSAVRAGDVLSPREAEALLASMDGVDFRAEDPPRGGPTRGAPHGRPVLLRIGVPEIARRFGR